MAWNLAASLADFPPPLTGCRADQRPGSAPIGGSDLASER